ncbi:hypothetical protein MAR_024919 [Mya arenaria]|uniref:Uncharacterized protein n=1 Tax=Mya arenaria TaxID=6604 RepID=A0ABY7DS63_MYAAR|nr:hypothetical protein MAR_024919 [Mya arenaria]
MKETLILEPLESEIPKNMLNEYHTNLQQVDSILKFLANNEDMSFNEFLVKCGISYENYILAIRSGLKKTQVFLKRRVVDMRVNAYNMGILKIWQANTDLQFVLDPWAVCVYISSYMIKSQRGMSKLLRHACEEAKAGNHTIRERMRIISNKLLNHCEVSAQEAVYLLLQMPLVQSSRYVVLINTSPHDQRKYAERPKLLEHISLAEFAEFFQEHIKRKALVNEDEADFDQTYLTIENIEPDIKIWLTNGGYLVKKIKPKVIRYVHFSHEKDPEMFYREKLMLFTPWRDEEVLKGQNGSYEHEFRKKEKQLLEAVDEIAPSSRQAEEEADSEKCDAIEHNMVQPNRPLHTRYDIGADIGLAINTHEEIIINNRLSNEEYNHLAQNLNNEQQQFF